MTLEELERRQAEAAARGESVLICTVIEDLPSGLTGRIAGRVLTGPSAERLLPEREAEAGG